MSREMRLRDGRIFRTHDTLGYSDYSGCQVERANVTVLVHDRDMVMRWPMSGIHWNAEHTVFQPIELNARTEWVDVEVDPDVDAIEFYGGHGSTELWLLDSDETRTTLKALDAYPAVSDEAVSEAETEAETDAWDNWLRADLLRTLPDDVDGECTCDGTDDGDTTCVYRLKSLRDQADSLSGSDLFECYREACEATNTYPEIETGGGVYVDLDRLAPAFREAVESRIR